MHSGLMRLREGLIGELRVERVRPLPTNISNVYQCFILNAEAVWLKTPSFSQPFSQNATCSRVALFHPNVWVGGW